MKKKTAVYMSVLPADQDTGVQCWLCQKDNTTFSTLFEFTDATEKDSVGGMELCVEHVDAIVNAVLQRHAVEVTTGNPRWFEQPDRIES